jgi:spermidine/putrescine transport system substrate-binding protein
MKKLVLVPVTLVALVLGALVSGCARDDGKTLYLFNWTYYTPDGVIAQFEEEYGVKVVVSDYDSNETMFAKLSAGATGYDVVVPSQDYVSILIKQGMLAPIDHAKMTNLGNINPLALEKATYDPTMAYSVPYFWGAAGVAVNKTKVAEYEQSWDIFSRTDLAGRMSMLDDYREVLGDALAFLGYSVNTLDPAALEAAKELVVTKWKPNLVKFDAEGFGKSFAAGDFWVVQGYAEVVFEEMPREKWGEVDFFIPPGGGPMYIDSLCVLKNSKHYDLALQFIDFIHRPEIYAQFLDTFHFPPTVNPGAAAFMTTVPHYSPEMLVEGELKNDIGEGLRVYDEVWQEIRFAN